MRIIYFRITQLLTLLPIVFATFSANAFAKVAEPVPDFKIWQKEYLDARANSVSSIIPDGVLLLSGNDISAIEKSIVPDSKPFQGISPLRFLDQKSALLTKKINRLDTRTKLPINLFAAAIPVNLVVTKTDSRVQDIYLNDGQKFTRIKSHNKFPGIRSPEKTIAWVFQSLGYDGFVVSKKGRYLLVGGLSSLFNKKEIQALAIKNSSSNIVLKNKTRSGLGLIQLVSADGPFALFQILALANQEDDIPVGTKLIIQKN